MKIFFITKRQYMLKDLLDDRFGRLSELALGLADLGHEVAGTVLSYSVCPEGEYRIKSQKTGKEVAWNSFNAGRFRPFGLARFARSALHLARAFKPDLIVASSDTFYIVLGWRLAHRVGVPFVADLYDNYESFSSARIPGLLPLYRYAIKAADGAMCISQPLATYLRTSCGRAGPIIVVENAIDAEVFHRRDRAECRRRLGLPEGALIVGTAGALYRNRNIEVLLRAFDILIGRRDDVVLALAGPRDIEIPDHPQVHDSGVLDWHDVANFVNALDVGVICNRDSAFGNFCFPQKAYEMIGCEIPICAAAVGSMKLLLEDWQQCLFEPDNAEGLAHVIEEQFARPIWPALAVPTWGGLARRTACFLESVVAGGTVPRLFEPDDVTLDAVERAAAATGGSSDRVTPSAQPPRSANS
ncbi:MAG: glycosyltransferase [Proteobacteria bacterium]|nr:glycosyltransferase [Pseudomonadota bacterium]